MSNTQHVADRLADAGAALSTASIGYAWLGTANEIAQLIATIIAIISGVLAGAYHVYRIYRLRKGAVASAPVAD